jgi:hypothetical protein
VFLGSSSFQLKLEAIMALSFMLNLNGQAGWLFYLLFIAYKTRASFRWFFPYKIDEIKPGKSPGHKVYQHHSYSETD